MKPIGFENWTYPPGNNPQRIKYKVLIDEHAPVSVEITGGLISDRNAELDNYGVYFYCNDRLIVKELKSREVGYFVPTEGGVPHPDASLCRVIVQLRGAARLMPWNSSKSDINTNHKVFQLVRPKIIQFVSHFSKLSRRTKDDWAGKVFAYTDGQIDDLAPSDSTPRGRLILPPLPRGNRSHVEQIKSQNRQLLQEQPWTLGLLEAVAAVQILARQKLETKNRIALVILDSNFEIALKEFIVHQTDLFPVSRYRDGSLQKLFSVRSNVIAEIKQKITIPDELLKKAQHYYDLRNKLIHERATVDVTDADIAIYRDTVQKVLNILFSLDFPET